MIRTDQTCVKKINKNNTIHEGGWRGREEGGEGGGSGGADDCTGVSHVFIR